VGEGELVVVVVDFGFFSSFISKKSTGVCRCYSYSFDLTMEMSERASEDK
jgi:hypothetical protein